MLLIIFRIIFTIDLNRLAVIEFMKIWRGKIEFIFTDRYIHTETSIFALLTRSLSH